MGVVEFHECPAPIRNPGRAKVRCPSEGWELQWEVTERVRGPNRWDALNMAGMITDTILFVILYTWGPFFSITLNYEGNFKRRSASQNAIHSAGL